MSLPDMLGLHFLWNEPSINITQFYDGPGGTITTNTSLMSLWDAGNMYGVSVDAWMHGTALNTQGHGFH